MRLGGGGCVVPPLLRSAAVGTWRERGGSPNGRQRHGTSGEIRSPGNKFGV